MTKHISVNLAPSLEQSVQLKRPDAMAAAQDILRINALALGEAPDLSWFERVVLRKGTERVPFQDDVVAMCRMTGMRLTISAHHVNETHMVNVHVEVSTAGGSCRKLLMTYSGGKRNEIAQASFT